MSDINDFTDNANPHSFEPAPGGGFGVNVKDKFIKHMTDSDKPECRYKRGDYVAKATWEEGDTHPIGTKGVILGTLYEKTLGEAYLVLFETSPVPIFTIERKIKLDVE